MIEDDVIDIDSKREVECRQNARNFSWVATDAHSKEVELKQRKILAQICKLQLGHLQC